jgi:Ca-activated chloride channel family protein
MKNNNAKIILALVVSAIVLFGLISGGIYLTRNLGKSNVQVTSENVASELQNIIDDITVTNVTPTKAQVDLEPTDVKNELPDISKYPPQVNNNTENYVEIFSSTEKTGDGKDGWLNEVAKDFNKSGITIDGKAVSVRLRGIASGTGADYITSKKYLPDAFTPSNELWGEMIKSQGIKIKLIEKRLAGNVAGILMTKKKQDELVKKYGSVNIKTITEAVSKNEISMGYTNPFASSTGLNFLLTALSTFDNKDILSDKAVQGFEKFQTNIPFVAYTTLQMRTSASQGVLDSFIMEYQTYVNSPELKDDYVFTPFGVRHDSPLYSIGDISAEKSKILNKFVEYCKKDKYKKLAEDYGFDGLNQYKSEMEAVNGKLLGKAQKLWKDKKNVNKDICAIFVADVSGSMEGEPINKLKQSLINGAKYIGTNNMVGLVSYSDDVNINLPVAKFDLNQRALFTGATQQLSAGGSTATFDAIAVAIKMLAEQQEKNPNIKPMLFVLSDGETNRGHTLDEIKGIVEQKKIPIYTIGYNADISALESISGINEAASINADVDDVVYKLASLFNAQM